MPTLRSATDWTSRDVDGVILGEPAIDPATNEFLWDHPGIPGDVIDTDGDIWQEVDNATP